MTDKKPLTDADLDAVEKAAKSATKGSWFTRPTKPGANGWSTCMIVAKTAPGKGNGVYTSSGSSFPAADCHHIATSDPEMALRLVAEIERLRRDHVSICTAGAHSEEALYKAKEALEAAEARSDRLRKHSLRVERERDKAKARVAKLSKALASVAVQARAIDSLACGDIIRTTSAALENTGARAGKVGHGDDG